ncbi:MAG: DNA polymerase III subunit alpha, partial [Chloroflexi bacterium]|nr:DNA polymerase III subunit alpha [Chloroflexota bacterium]
IPHDDPATFALLQTGETTGLFQLESAGMRKYLKELKPTTIGDISAMISLYRPGPMANIPKFIAAKNGYVEAQYLHPDLEPILEESYGVIVYQEQVMAIVTKVAGFTTEQGYKFIKAIAKKNAELLQQQKEPFVAGALERGYSSGIIEELWRLFEPFQRYSFNKAHTMAYAHVTYRTAYMKTHFPAEFMAAVLCSHRDTQEKLGADIAECRRMGISVLPPDINHSEADFSVENGAIRFGLAAIKNVGTSVVESLVAERQRNGPFTSLEDFCQRIDARTLNKKALESLIKAGCLDCFGDRASLLHQIDRIITLALQTARTAAAGKISMFDRANEQPTPIFAITPSRRDPTNLKQYYSWERELLGVYFGEHPLNALTSRLHQHNTIAIGEITEDILGTKVTIAGMLTTSRTIATKSGQPMLYATIEDLSGTIEVTVFPRLYENTRQLWEANYILLITGRLDQRNDSYQVVCDSVERLPDHDVMAARRHLRITIPPLHDPLHDRLRLERVALALRDAPGNDTVELRVRTPVGLVLLATPTLRTQWSLDLEERIQHLLGRDALEVFHQPHELLAAAS